MNGSRWTVYTAVLLCALILPGGCQPPSPDIDQRNGDAMPELAAVSLTPGQKLRVVATTTIVADVVANVGGDHIALTTLIPVGTDPHSFEPTPNDMAAVADAHVVFINGAGLETFIEKLLAGARERTSVVPLSHGIELISLPGHDDDRDHTGGDPHTWFDPLNVIVWTHNAERALAALDPTHASFYRKRADAYEARLRALDAWIQEQIEPIPSGSRQLVTDHASFSYFCQRYGFEQVGAVFPGYSTLSQPSAKELAELEDAIRALGIKAVFTGVTTNPELTTRIANDTGTRLVFLYTGSLSEPDGPAGDYISLIEYNVAAIADALR